MITYATRLADAERMLHEAADAVRTHAATCPLCTSPVPLETLRCRDLEPLQRTASRTSSAYYTLRHAIRAAVTGGDWIDR